MSKRETYQVEVDEYLSLNNRSHFFRILKGDHKHETDGGTSCFPAFIFEAMQPAVAGDRFEVTREFLEDEVVVRVRRISSNPKSKPKICPYTAKVVARNPDLKDQPTKHNPKRHRRLRDYVRRNPHLIVHALADNGEIHETRINRVFIRAGVGYAELDGFPYPHPSSRVYLRDESVNPLNHWNTRDVRLRRS